MAVTTSYQSEKSPCWKGKSKAGTTVIVINKVPCHEDIRCHGGIIPHIPKLHTKRRWVRQIHAPITFPQRKSPWYPPHRKLGGPQNHSGHSKKREKSLTSTGIELWLCHLWPNIKLLDIPWTTMVTSPISSVILIQIWQKWIYEIHHTGNNQEDKFLIFLYYFQDNHYVGLTFP